MDIKEVTDRIETLCRDIEQRPGDGLLYMERGRLYHRTGEFHRAYNDFLRARELTGPNAEADGYIELLRDIFAFRYNDLYNP